MPDQGVDLGADLYKLLVVAKDNLPSVSVIYGDAMAKYNQALSGLAAAMQRPEHFGGSPGPVYGAWTAFHGIAAKFMSDTRSSLDATAAALEKAVEMYAATDQAAAAELKRLRESVGEPEAGR
jgi:hypothetical protein